MKAVKNGLKQTARGLQRLLSNSLAAKLIAQGGIISPTLANMALDGIQSLLADNFKKTDKIHFVRYADDFIITGRSRNCLNIVSNL